MERCRFDIRLFMIMETNDNFSFAIKTVMDSGNSKVQEWEKLMLDCQQPLKKAVNGEK
jgi:L-rhamnose mutarotase